MRAISVIRRKLRTINGIFGISDSGTDGTFKTIVIGEVAAFGTRDLMHLFGSSYCIAYGTPDCPETGKYQSPRQDKTDRYQDRLN